MVRLLSGYQPNTVWPAMLTSHGRQLNTRHPLRENCCVLVQVRGTEAIKEFSNFLLTPYIPEARPEITDRVEQLQEQVEQLQHKCQQLQSQLDK